MFLEHHRGSVLTLLATAPKTNLVSPLGSPLGPKGRTELTWHSAAMGSCRQSLYSHQGMPLPLPFQGVCALGCLQTPPSTTALRKHGSTCSPQLAAGRQPQPGQEQPPTLGSWQAPCNPSQPPHLLPPASALSFLGCGHWQDSALLLPRLLAERQELIVLWVRPAPHLIAPLARKKINSTFYTLVASVLKFWHICQAKKKKVIKPRKCHLIVLAELIWRLRCSGVISL